ncbi:Quinone oxidoreductase 2 [Nonomuraea coxensis DSM 45129]|uniref:Quinone oxidoreductase 2 n=1 Tax=Nonomuraea coxensis DSM 45129 TaxID=1122611 RepID=A0ABX8TQ62_9ACTN|nr:NAD(P)H-binding protein [Nonomuraea coxensis]QYC37655.1 Quinone oxidoreductase 2 [Nonomuraea coxensis DSM 45129]
MILVTGISGGLGGLIHHGLSAHYDLDPATGGVAAAGGATVAGGGAASAGGGAAVAGGGAASAGGGAAVAGGGAAVAGGGAAVVGGTRSGDGVTARRIDFDDPASLTDGFRDVDVLVFVSAGYAEDDVVLARHGAVADAAEAAGVRHVVYTSLARSGEPLTIAPPHRWTEARLAAAPFEVTILRNGLYAEIPAGLAALGAATAAETGVFAAALGAGRMSTVAREDLADVAVRVTAEIQHDLAAGRRSRHAGRTYELEGVETVGGDDLAEALADALNRPVRYQPIPLSAAREALTGLGLEPYQVTHTLSTFSNVIAGNLQAGESDLPALLPTPPRPVRDQIVQTLAAAGHTPATTRTR